MASSAVGQSSLLSDILGGALRRYSPESVAVVGCAGGNGFEEILAYPQSRVVGIDLNPEFIDETARRFKALLPNLHLIVGDIETTCFSFAPVKLVFAGLVFEYVDVERSLRNIRRMLSADGVVVAVLQLPSEGREPVTPSPYVSLQSLKDHMSLVRPERFTSLATIAGFCIDETEVRKAGGGKELLVVHLHPT